jgi:DinB superfamily/Ankyrin repeats (many copies)
MTGPIKDELLALSREAWTRLRKRLDGLTDDEYLWEPFPGCWTIRPREGGVFRPDRSVMPPDPPPFTTIAWRIAHITDILAQERNATWLGLEPEAPDDLTAEPTADRALARLERANERWERYLTEATDEALWRKLGPTAGPYADATGVGFVLHELDELIHHGAEVAVLRDWYRAVHAPADGGDPPLVAALLRGDRAMVEQAQATDPGALDRVRAEHPGLVARAGAEGRWGAVPLLVELGFDVNAKGDRTALHDAAGAGDLEMVRFLVESGADTTIRDDVFNVGPVGWARHLGRSDVMAYLRAHRQS